MIARLALAAVALPALTIAVAWVLVRVSERERRISRYELEGRRRESTGPSSKGS